MIITLLPISSAAAQERRESASDLATKIDRIVDKYQRDASGTEYPAENGWTRLVGELAEVRQALPHEFVFDDKIPLDFSVLHDEARAKRRMAEGLDVTAIEDKARNALKDLEDRGLLDKFDWIISHRRFARPGQAGRALDWQLPELAPARHLCRGIAAKMVLAARAEDWRRVTTSFEQMLALGRVFMHQPMMIDQLVGVSIRHLATSNLREVLLEHRPPATVLDELALAIERQLHSPSIALVLESERLLALDAIELAYEDKSAELLTRLGSRFDETWTKDHAKLLKALLAPIAESKAKLNESYDRLLRASYMEPRNSIVDAIEFKKEKEEWPLALGAAQIFMVDAERGFVARVQHDAEMAGTRLMIAIERFRAKEGELPETLEGLAPKFIAEIPDDPYWPRGFCYRRVRESDNRSGYLLYSPGYDQRDDQGVVHANGAGAAANPKTTAPCDYVFNAAN